MTVEYQANLSTGSIIKDIEEFIDESRRYSKPRTTSSVHLLLKRLIVNVKNRNLRPC